VSTTKSGTLVGTPATVHASSWDSDVPSAGVADLPGNLVGTPAAVHASSWDNGVPSVGVADLPGIAGKASTIRATEFSMDASISPGGNIDEHEQQMSSGKGIVPTASPAMDPDTSGLGDRNDGRLKLDPPRGPELESQLDGVSTTKSGNLVGTPAAVHASSWDNGVPSAGVADLPGIAGKASTIRATEFSMDASISPGGNTNDEVSDSGSLNGFAQRVGAVSFDNNTMPSAWAGSKLPADAAEVPSVPSEVLEPSSTASGEFLVVGADVHSGISSGTLRDSQRPNGKAPNVWASSLDVNASARKNANGSDEQNGALDSLDGVNGKIQAPSTNQEGSSLSNSFVASAPAVKAGGFDSNPQLEDKAPTATTNQGGGNSCDCNDVDENAVVSFNLDGKAPAVQATGFDTVPPASGPGDYGELSTLAVNLAHKKFVDGPDTPTDRVDELTIESKTEAQPEPIPELEPEPQLSYEEEIKRRAEEARQDTPDELAVALARLRYGGVASDTPALAPSPNTERDGEDDDDEDRDGKSNQELDESGGVTSSVPTSSADNHGARPGIQDWLPNITFEPSSVEINFEVEPRTALKFSPQLLGVRTPAPSMNTVSDVNAYTESTFLSLRRSDPFKPPLIRPRGRDDEIARLLARGTRQRQHEQEMQRHPAHSYRDVKHQIAIKSAHEPVPASLSRVKRADETPGNTTDASNAVAETEVLLDAAPGQLRGADLRHSKSSPAWWSSVPSSHSHVAGASQSLSIQLREAAARGDSSMVERLLGEGVDINSAPGMTGATALHAASERGHTAIVKMLLLRGAEPSAMTTSGETALDRATYQGHAGCVRALLSHGADPNRVASTTGWSPVSMATSLQHHSAARYLQSGAAQTPAPRSTSRAIRSSSRGATSLWASPTRSSSQAEGSKASSGMDLSTVSPWSTRQKLQFSPPARSPARPYRGGR
jgi:hypothetical protein